LVSVTIGIGDFIHISKANARGVSLGLISCFILGDLRGTKVQKMREEVALTAQHTELALLVGNQ
jgi:hypothetical protein